MLKDIDKEIIRCFADSNLRIAGVVKSFYMCRGTVYYHVGKIKKKTGLNPTNFWDLLELLKMVGAIDYERK